MTYKTICMLFLMSLIVACSPNDPQPDIKAVEEDLLANYKINSIIASGEFVKRVTIQERPLNNCGNEDEVELSATRSRTLDESVDITLAVGIAGMTGAELGLKGELGIAIGGEYGVSHGQSLSDESQLSYTVSPNKFPVYTFSWKEKWEKGYITVTIDDDKEEKLEYFYLTSAYPEPMGAEYFECNDTGLAKATAIANGELPWQADFEAGKKAYADGNYEKAINFMTKVIEVEPEKVSAYNYRGRAYYNLGEYEKAIANYDESIRLNPESAIIYNNRGRAYYNLGEYEKAIANYDESIRLNPESAIIYNNRGRAYYNLHEYEKALADYSESIRLDPDDADAYFGRGNTYKQLKENDKAIADFKKYLELSDDEYWRNEALKHLEELGVSP